MSDWASLLEWRKIGIPLAGVVCVFSGAILFLPQSFMENAGLTEIRKANLTWIGLIFLASGSVFISLIIETLWNFFREALGGRTDRKSQRGAIDEITPEEKRFLREFVASGEAAFRAPAYHSVVSSLEVRRIMIRTSNLSGPGLTFPYALQPWARAAILADPSLLDAHD